MTNTSFPVWMSNIQARIDHTLERLLPTAHIVPERLHEAMRYSMLNGGKRVRPLLAHATAEFVGAQPERADIIACAVEMIHAYSLVHDDLPCMDNDTLRRGQPTCHVKYDEATAMLVGDALQSLAFFTLSQQQLTEDPKRQLEMVHILAQAAGSRGMAGGQAIDIDATGKQLAVEELEFMHIHKTGALIRAAVLLGALCGTPQSAEDTEHLDHFAKRAGLLFQVVDDILDSEASTATLGKTAGKDIAQNKPTYVSVLGLAGAQDMATELHQDALNTLNAFGSRAARLIQLTDFIVTRKF